MIDRAKLIDEAQKSLAKGQIDKAIAAWEKIASVYPDGNTLNLVGDLYLKKKDSKAALEKFHKAAKFFTDEGFTLKGLAIYKKILNVNPHDADALLALAQLNEDKKITTDAIKYYLAAADSLAKDNKREDVLKTYKRIINIAPSNIQLRSKVAELYSKSGFSTEASTEHLELGRLYMLKNEYDKANEHFMKSMEMMPTNKNALLALSDIAEKTNNMNKALNYTKIAIERVGEQPELLLRYSQLLVKSGLYDEASHYIVKVIAKDPENIEARLLSASIHLNTGEMDKAWDEYQPLIDYFTSNDKFLEAAEILVRFKGAQPLESRKLLISVYKQAGDESGATSELDALAGIYSDKGMKEESLQCLKDILEIQPENEDVRKKIEIMEPQPELVPQSEFRPEPIAMTEWPLPEAEPGALLEPEEGFKEGQEPLLEPDISSLYGTSEPSDKEAAPETSEVLQPFPDTPETSPPAYGEPEFTAPAIEAEQSSEELMHQAGEKPKSLEEALTEADIFIKYKLYDDALSLLGSLKVRVPENIDVHEKLKNIYQSTNDTEMSVTECIILSNLYKRAYEDEKSKEYLDEAYRLNPEDPRLSTLSRKPEAEKIPEPETMTPAPEGEISVPQAEVPDVAGGELQKEIEEPPLDSEVMEIFDEFKKGLEEEIGTEDTDTHYNLGIAYKEMGLMDDAIVVFQKTSRDPDYFVRSTTMLGLCYMEAGNFQKAIDSFSTALKKIPPNNESSWSLRFDLAGAYEKNGNIEEAYDLYNEVCKWNPDFRGVAGRLEALRKTPEPAAQKEKKSRVSYI